MQHGKIIIQKAHRGIQSADSYVTLHCMADGERLYHVSTFLRRF